MTSLNKEQRDYLEDQKSKIVDFRVLVVEKYTPAIFENIKEIRELVRNLSITSGAIGALTISLLEKDLVRSKPLAIAALATFLFVVWLGFFYLKYILEKENNQLTKRTSELHAAISGVRDQIDKALREDSLEEAKKFPKTKEKLEEVIKREDSVDNKFTRNIGDLMLIPFTVASILIIISFFDINMIFNSLLSDIHR